MERIKFKVGDRVRVVLHKSNDESIPVGSIGTVADESELPWVVLEDPALNTETIDFTEIGARVFLQEELELVESEVSNG